MSGNTLTWLIAGGAVILLAGSGVYVAGNNNLTDVPAAAGAVIALAEENHDWGRIKIDGGNVTKEFKIANEGVEPLKLFNVSTSCMCTTARLVKSEEQSPEFGMHTKSPYIMELLPGEEARTVVVFDPAFHGPSGLGPITRQVVLSTNDPQRERVQFSLRGVVVK